MDEVKKIRQDGGQGSLWIISEGPGKAPEKRLIPALGAADARTFGADNSVMGINDLFVLFVLCCAVMCSGMIQTPDAYWVTASVGRVAVGVSLCTELYLSVFATALAASILTSRVFSTCERSRSLEKSARRRVWTRSRCLDDGSMERKCQLWKM